MSYLRFYPAQFAAAGNLVEFLFYPSRLSAFDGKRTALTGQPVESGVLMISSPTANIEWTYFEDKAGGRIAFRPPHYGYCENGPSSAGHRAC